MILFKILRLETFTEIKIYKTWFLFVNIFFYFVCVEA